MGPCVKKLIARRMARQMIPDSGGPLDGFNALTSGNLGGFAKEATTWVEEAIAVVKTSHDNPYGDDDEAIAQAILSNIPGVEI